MKKFFVMFITVIIMLNCISVYAYASEYFYDESINSDIQEIENRADYIVHEVNVILEKEDKNPIENKDIDYSKMVKISSATGLFENEKIDENIISEEIKKNNYNYSLPVNCDGITVLLTINKGTPLTEKEYEIYTQEDIEFYESQIGEWVIPSIDILPDSVDYKAEIENTLKKNNIDSSKVYIISGISPSIHLAAVICTDNDIQFKVLEQFEPMDKDYEKGYIPFDKNALYSYDEVKTVVDKENEEYQKLQELYGDEEMIIGDGLPYSSQTDKTLENKILIISIVSGVAVVAIAVAVICVIRKKKAKNIES